MGKSILILAVARAQNIQTNQQAGIVFQQLKNERFYNHNLKSTINVAIPTPRMLLNFEAPEFEYCDKKFSRACTLQRISTIFVKKT